MNGRDNEWMKPKTVFALMFYFSYTWMVANGMTIPDTLNGFVNLLMGAYFGERFSRRREGDGK
jgi:hypothetical protein